MCSINKREQTTSTFQPAALVRVLANHFLLIFKKKSKIPPCQISGRCKNVYEKTKIMKQEHVYYLFSTDPTERRQVRVMV